MAQATELKMASALTGKTTTDKANLDILQTMFSGGIKQNQQNAKDVSLEFVFFCSRSFANLKSQGCKGALSDVWKGAILVFVNIMWYFWGLLEVGQSEV